MSHACQLAMKDITRTLIKALEGEQPEYEYTNVSGEKRTSEKCVLTRQDALEVLDKELLVSETAMMHSYGSEVNPTSEMTDAEAAETLESISHNAEAALEQEELTALDAVQTHLDNE